LRALGEGQSINEIELIDEGFFGLPEDRKQWKPEEVHDAINIIRMEEKRSGEKGPAALLDKVQSRLAEAMVGGGTAWMELKGQQYFRKVRQ